MPEEPEKDPEVLAELEQELAALGVDAQPLNEDSQVVRFNVADIYRNKMLEREQLRVRYVAESISAPAGPGMVQVKGALERNIEFMIRWRRLYPWVVEEAAALQKMFEEQTQIQKPKAIQSTQAGG